MVTELLGKVFGANYSKIYGELMRGVGADRLYQQLRPQLPGISRKYFRQLGGYVRTVEATSVATSRLDIDKLIGPELTVESELNFHTKYMYLVSYAGPSTITGDWEERYAYIGEDYRLTKRQVMDILNQKIADDPGKYPIDVQRMSVVTQFIRKGETFR